MKDQIANRRAPYARCLMLCVTASGLAAPCATQHHWEQLGKQHVPPSIEGAFWPLVLGADADGDGDLDLGAVVERQGHLEFFVFRNDGHAVFERAADAGVHVANASQRVAAWRDLDRDGDPDLVVGRTPYDGGGLGEDLVFENVGGGRYVDRSDRLPTTGNETTVALIIEDLDRNGLLDVVLGHADAPNALWLQTAPWVFTRIASVPWSGSTAATTGLAIADLEGDGDLDLFEVAHGGAGPNDGLRIWENRGAGNFHDATTAWLSEPQQQATGILVEDLNGDGRPDVLLDVGQQVLQFWNTGNRLSRLPNSLPYVSHLQGVQLADLDGNGLPDLCAPNAAYLQHSSFNFGGPPRMVSPPRMRNGAAILLSGDLDSDGDIDLVRAAGGMHWMDVVLNDGAAGLRSGSTDPIGQFGVWGWELEVLDLNGDGFEDLLVEDFGSLRVFQSDRYEGFVETTSAAVRAYTDVLGNVAAYRVFDADGDGDRDVFVVGDDHPGSSAYRWRYLLRNDGHGVLEEVSDFALRDAGAPVELVAHGDWDGDGDIDLVLQEAQSRVLVLLANDGAGRFSEAASQSVPYGSGGNDALTLADADADGDLDLVLADSLYGARLLRNNGSGGFTRGPVDWLPVGPFHSPKSVAVADVDRDGWPDLLFGEPRPNGPGSGMRLFLGGPVVDRFVEATSTHLPPAFPSLWRDVSVLETADLDRDGDLDIVLGDGESYHGDYGMEVVLENDGTGHFRDASPEWLRPDSLDVGSITLADLDGDDDLDLVRMVNDFRLQGVFVTHDVRGNLRAPWLARLGQPFRYEVVADPGTVVSVFVAPREGSWELPGLGRMRLDPASHEWLGTATVPAGADRALLAVQIPHDAALLGLTLYAQAALSLSGSTRLSTATRDVIGG